MKKISERLGIYLPALILVTVAATVLRTVALFTEFNPAVGYFTNGICIAVADWITAFAAVFFLSYIFLTPKMELAASFDNAATYIPAGLVSVALLFMSAELLFIVRRKTGAFLSRETLTDPFNILIILIAVFAIVCIINFFFTVFFTKKDTETRAAFGIATIIFLAAYAAYLYFDTSLPINAPNKTADQMAYLFSALFFIYETRISLGREKWRAYISFGFIASLITAYSSIPTLIYYFARGEMLSNNLAESVLTFTLFIYITARLLLTGRLPNVEKSAVAQAIDDFIIKRKESELAAIDDQTEDAEEDESDIGENYEIEIPEVNQSNDSEEEVEAE